MVLVDRWVADGRSGSRGRHGRSRRNWRRGYGVRHQHRAFSSSLTTGHRQHVCEPLVRVDSRKYHLLCIADSLDVLLTVTICSTCGLRGMSRGMLLPCLPVLHSRLLVRPRLGL